MCWSLFSKNLIAWKKWLTDLWLILHDKRGPCPVQKNFYTRRKFLLMNQDSVSKIEKWGERLPGVWLKYSVVDLDCLDVNFRVRPTIKTVLVKYCQDPDNADLFLKEEKVVLDCRGDFEELKAVWREIQLEFYECDDDFLNALWGYRFYVDEIMIGGGDVDVDVDVEEPQGEVILGPYGRHIFTSWKFVKDFRLMKKFGRNFHLDWLVLEKVRKLLC
jgi:hypothetical protein